MRSGKDFICGIDGWHSTLFVVLFLTGTRVVFKENGRKVESKPSIPMVHGKEGKEK